MTEEHFKISSSIMEKLDRGDRLYLSCIYNEKNRRIDKMVLGLNQIEEFIKNRIEDINNGGNEHSYRDLEYILRIVRRLK